MMEMMPVQRKKGESETARGVETFRKDKKKRKGWAWCHRRVERKGASACSPPLCRLALWSMHVYFNFSVTSHTINIFDRY